MDALDEFEIYVNGMIQENGMTALDAQLGLDKVRVKKDDLLKKLKENRSKHKEEHIEALKGWKEQVLFKMNENLDLAKNDEKWNLHINEEKPQDHTGDYDHVISLLEASIDDVVVITATEFRQYHDDQWRWKHDHMESVLNYTSRR